MVQDLFLEVAGVLALAAALAAVAFLLRQPLIVAFLAAGILAGPAAFHIVRTEGLFETLAELGVALLLFSVGLKLDPRLIRTLGPVAGFTGIGQIVFTSAIGFGIALLFTFGVVEALYVAVALTFSSTIIITKLLSDKRELESLHGRIALGFLIVQDVFVVLVLVGLPLVGGMGAEQETTGWRALVLVGLSALALFVGVYLLVRLVFPRLVPWLARSRELLVLFAVTWGIALGGLAEYVGLGLEMGAFVAGLSLASSEYREAIGSRLVSLRDVLLLFFFVTLGASLDLGLLAAQVPAAAVLSLFVLVGNPLIVMVILGLLGFRKRTGFLAGLTVAQISEFSLVLGALGLGLGHIGPDAMGLITLVGLVTISVSSYLILYSYPVYEWIKGPLGVFERRAPWREERWREEQERDARTPDVVVFGLGRFGQHLVRLFVQRGFHVKGIDLDTTRLATLRREGLEVLYGDAGDEEFPLTLPLAHVPLVVSTIPEVGTNRVLQKALDASEFGGRFVVTAHTREEADPLRASGMEVMQPFEAAGREMATRLADWLASEQGEPG